jgi:hypothetical protein
MVAGAMAYFAAVSRTKSARAVAKGTGTRSTGASAGIASTEVSAGLVVVAGIAGFAGSPAVCGAGVGDFSGVAQATRPSVNRQKRAVRVIGAEGSMGVAGNSESWRSEEREVRSEK